MSLRPTRLPKLRLALQLERFEKQFVSFGFISGGAASDKLSQDRGKSLTRALYRSCIHHQGGFGRFGDTHQAMEGKLSF